MKATLWDLLDHFWSCWRSFVRWFVRWFVCLFRDGWYFTTNTLFHVLITCAYCDQFFFGFRFMLCLIVCSFPLSLLRCSLFMWTAVYMFFPEDLISSERIPFSFVIRPKFLFTECRRCHCRFFLFCFLFFVFSSFVACFGSSVAFGVLQVFEKVHFLSRFPLLFSFNFANGLL